MWGHSVEELQSSLHSIEPKQQQSIGLFCEASLDREDNVHGISVRDTSIQVAGWCVGGASKPCSLRSRPESQETLGKDQ